MVRSKVNLNTDLKPQLEQVKAVQHLDLDKDIEAEEILNEAKNSPIGKLLSQIASLPEIRQDKVLRARQQIAEGKFDSNERLDAALDSVLEELLAG